MPFIRLLVPALLLLSVPALAADMTYPVKKDDYLKRGEAAFDKMDRNNDAQLQDGEASEEFAQQLNPFISKQTQEVCVQSGKTVSPQLQQLGLPQTQEAKTLTRADFINSYSTMFTHFDADNNDQIEEAEAQAANQQMAQMCADAPAMIQKIEAMKTQAMQNAMRQEGMDPEALKSLPPSMQELIKQAEPAR